MKFIYLFIALKSFDCVIIQLNVLILEAGAYKQKEETQKMSCGHY